MREELLSSVQMCVEASSQCLKIRRNPKSNTRAKTKEELVELEDLEAREGLVTGMGKAGMITMDVASKDSTEDIITEAAMEIIRDSMVAGTKATSNGTMALNREGEEAGVNLVLEGTPCLTLSATL